MDHGIRWETLLYRSKRESFVLSRTGERTFALHTCISPSETETWQKWLMELRFGTWFQLVLFVCFSFSFNLYLLLHVSCEACMHYIPFSLSVLYYPQLGGLFTSLFCCAFWIWILFSYLFCYVFMHSLLSLPLCLSALGICILWFLCIWISFFLSWKWFFACL
jgi:hypothetical protein